jgi:hypothetical protein
VGVQQNLSSPDQKQLTQINKKPLVSFSQSNRIYRKNVASPEIDCLPQTDPLSELAESIRSLQERFSDFGVVIEAKIVAS